MFMKLAQFAFFGGVLFAVAPPADRSDVIDISRARLAALEQAEATKKGRASATAAEVDQRELEDEILYREGVRLGLDKNDGIVRQRVVQKVLFLAEEMAGATRKADDAALRAFFEEHKDQWAVGEETRFEQIYRHRPDALRAWIEAKGELPVGEASPVSAVVDEDTAHIVAQLGEGFASALATAPVGTWAGPLPSTFGWHLVRVVERRPARPARFEDVRPTVAEAFSVYRRQEAVATFVTTAFARYRVAVDGQPLTQLTPSRRVAFRSITSGED
jgi:parvulin-like peptidyl-prolyl isomerase